MIVRLGTVSLFMGTYHFSYVNIYALGAFGGGCEEHTIISQHPFCFVLVKHYLITKKKKKAA